MYTLECKILNLKSTVKSTGDRLVTSASDGFARVWSDKGEIKSIFNCNNIPKTHNSSYYNENNVRFP